MAEQHRSEPRTPPARTADVEKRRVLVVDDDLPVRSMLSAALRRQGFGVLLAANGGEAERALSFYTPHVILLDLMMPEVNGWDFLQRLQETGKKGRIPVIVISAHLQHAPQALLQMGVAAILPKPFNLSELMDLIEHVAL